MREADRDRPSPLHDVIVVGAGPAGLGVAAALARIDVTALVVDRCGIGASFRRWHPDMRLLTPSFTGNQFGAVDLNAITPDTSPALSLAEEHPTGEQYARYLEMVADLEQLQVRTGVEVADVRPADHGHLVVETDGEPLRARAVVWAAGELQYPRTGGFPGAELCPSPTGLTDWEAVTGDEVVVIGGYESGIDAAINLVARGRSVTVLDRAAPWDTVDADPSRALSPFTHSRLRAAYATGLLDLVADVDVTEVRDLGGSFAVLGDDGEAWKTEGPPLLATGFEGSLSIVRDRFALDDAGRVQLTEDGDASTVVPGLHLAGPMLAHRGAIFCFIYKFRQRFGVVARAIGTRLGVDTDPLESLRTHGFLLDDLSCCDDACAC